MFGNLLSTFLYLSAAGVLAFMAWSRWFDVPSEMLWTGAAGGVIRIKAVDDVQVTQVTVLITDSGGTVLEQGAAANSGGGWWTYTTQTEVSGSPRVVASARDLPGHIAEMEWED